MLMGFSFWHCICISQIVDLFVDISSLRIHVLVTSHQLLFEITVKFIKYTNFFRTKLHYTISTKIFKNLTVLYCLQSLRKENLKRLIYTMYTELSLINPMNQIHWWRSFTWYMYDHPGFRERCFEQIWIYLHDRCTCTWKLWKYYLALIENFRHLSYLRCPYYFFSSLTFFFLSTNFMLRLTGQTKYRTNEETD